MSERTQAGLGSTEPQWILTRREMLSGTLALSFTLAASSALGVGPTRPATRKAPPSAQALAAMFPNPPQEFAPVDNWWWEAGKVDREKLVWTLEELKDKGIGGTWFYVRFVYGESLTSLPHYWSDEWWDLTRFSVEQHQKLGLTHYFSNWTLTQFQQDLVRKQKSTEPALEGRKLVLHRLDKDGTLELPAGDEILDVAAYRVQGAAVDYPSRIPLADKVREGRIEWQAPGPGWLLGVVASRPWDLAYTDREVGRRFAENFLGEYEKRMPGHIGKTLAAFGADEMTLLDGEVLFSRALIDKIRNERGYDLTPQLLALFYDIGAQTDRARCDYYDAMTALLEENFYKAPSDWLEQRGMKHVTLSQLGAGDPLHQTAELGDIFRYLRTFHEPGNEDPERTKPGKRRLLASKLSSSVAHLYGRSRTVMCVHYASGWGMTQEENLAWTNESYAKGLNLYCRHGGYHTLAGGWYEWVPPMDHFYQPHWAYWKAFTAYVTRVSAVLSQGVHRADVALFYPLTTIHANWVAGRKPMERFFEMDEANDHPRPFEPGAVAASDTLQSLANALYEDGIDFNFTDNDSLERATVKGGVLDIAGVEFRSVVLPALTTIRLACMEKLREFYREGGTIVSYDRLPTASAENGRDDPRLRALLEAIFGRVSVQGVPESLDRRNGRGGKALFVSSNAARIAAAVSSAIVRDVSAPEKELFHIHKKIGELDVYFLFNVREEKRQLPVRLRAHGNVEIWDSHTGERRPVHRVKRNGETTEVRLEMERNEAVMLVFSPQPTVPCVVEDDVTFISSVDARGDELVLRGFDDAGGSKSAWLQHRGRMYFGAAQVAVPSKPLKLEGPYDFRLEPTMDNRWGDYRYPASKRLIGAEARRFRYREESGGETGVDAGWQGASYDDSAWEDVLYSYGPYWWRIGPLPDSAQVSALLEQARRGKIDFGRAWSVSGRSLNWEQYTFSQKFGYFTPPQVHSRSGLEGLLGVPENFLVMDGPPPGKDTYCFFTHVRAAAEGEYFLHIGARAERLFFSNPNLITRPLVPTRARAWVNGEQLPLELTAETADAQVRVRLRKGVNTVLLEAVRPDDGQLGLYAVFLKSSQPPQEQAHIPLLRWFKESQGLVYDIRASGDKRVGWYRFSAPPGTRSLELQVKGESVQAWVDGQPAPIENGKISLGESRPHVAQVALRVIHEVGAYGGAAFDEPVAFECGEGQLAPGDWSRSGLATYSGVAVYSKNFELKRAHLQGRVLIDLGSARSVAELFINGKSAGVRLARPFSFDVTSLVREGVNRVEIKVANTLANHMSSYPTRWVLEGQTVSGLLGPVEIVFHAPVDLVARIIPA